MILTYGNIKKSHMLRYVFHDDLPTKLYEQKCAEYGNLVKDILSKDYFKVNRYLHDARLKIEETSDDVIFHCNSWDQEKNVAKDFDLIFKKAKIVSWNKFRKSGHISRMNRPVVPYEFGYDEFYTHGKKNYVSVIVFTNHRNKTNVGCYYPIVTIKYENIEVKDA